jgi:hypothetical protein
MMKWSVLELSRNTRTLRLDSIRVLDRWELDRISGGFSVGAIVTQKLVEELDGTVLRIESRFETSKQVFKYNYIPMHPRDGEKYWFTAIHAWLVKNVHKSIVGVIRPIIDQSKILQSTRKIFKGMPDDAWRVRVQQILQSDTPPGPKPWADEDRSEITQRIVKSVLASDIEGSLNLLWWTLKTSNGPIAPSASGSKQLGGPRPRATEHNLLELVTRWTGFVRPSVAGPSCLVDDLTLPGVDESHIFEDQKKYYPGIWRVTYRREPSSRFGCVVQSVVDLHTGKGVDHRDPRVMHQVFRRYVLIFLIFQHTQSHLHNVLYGEYARRCLHAEDPVRLLAEECTSLHGTVEHVTADLLFFSDIQKHKSMGVGGRKDAMVYYNIPKFVEKVLTHQENCMEQRRVLYENPAILQFSPVMQYMRDFHVICDRFLQQVQRHEDPRLGPGRRELSRACGRLADNSPQFRPAVETAVHLLDRIFRNVLQHLYSHTALTHSDSHTAALFLSSITTDRVWESAAGGTDRILAFGHPPTNSIEGSSELPLFGRRFQAILRQYPHLSAGAGVLLEEIQVLSDRARTNGIYLFTGIRSYIDR